MLPRQRGQRDCEGEPGQGGGAQGNGGKCMRWERPSGGLYPSRSGSNCVCWTWYCRFVPIHYGRSGHGACSFFVPGHFV